MGKLFKLILSAYEAKIAAERTMQAHQVHVLTQLGPESHPKACWLFEDSCSSANERGL